MSGPGLAPRNTHDDRRLTGLWLALARLGWLLSAALVVGLTALAVPRTYANLVAAAPRGPVCFDTQVAAAGFAALPGAAISPAFYATWIIAVGCLSRLIFVAVGALLFWRRSDDRVALLAAVTLVLYGGTFGDVHWLGTSCTLREISPVLAATFAILNFVGNYLCFPALFYLFPSGRWVPRWSRWLMALWVVYGVAASVTQVLYVLRNLLAGFIAFIALSATTILAQVYRYRRVSTPAERQQTKWVVFGYAIGIGAFLVIILASLLATPPNAVTWKPMTQLVGGTAIELCVLAVPISLAVAMLRSRLFDIDLLINRALVYGTLTVLLTVLYVAMTIGVERLTGSLFGHTAQEQPVLIVGATLLIAALFQPLRRRIQASIDKRFYRRKYDAARTLAAFAAILRMETDLEALRAHLEAAVEQTMQPAHVLLWLRPPDPAARRQAPV
jgi:hypothetical protein